MIEIKQSKLADLFSTFRVHRLKLEESKNELAERVELRDEMAAALSRNSESTGLFEWAWVILKSPCGSRSHIYPQAGRRVSREEANSQLVVADDVVSKSQRAVTQQEKQFADWRSGLSDFAAVSVEELDVLMEVASAAKLSQRIADVQTESETLAELAGDAERAAWIRNEVRHSCGCNRNGHSSVDIAIGEHVIRVCVDAMDDVAGARHRICNLRRWDLAEIINRPLPPRLRNVSLNTLRPWLKSPVTVKQQEKAIAGIPSRLPDALRGWLLVGPPGTSKSTFAAAGIQDWLTWRIATNPAAAVLTSEDNLRHETSLLVIHVPDWLQEMQAWDHRDFGDDSVPEPEYTPRNITESAREYGLRPILLLEEIDKFTPTDNRRQLLFRLVDAVYRANGVIVTTANTPLRQLEEMVGEPVFRRLSGTNDSDESYMVWDFFRLVPKKQKTQTDKRGPLT